MVTVWKYGDLEFTCDRFINEKVSYLFVLLFWEGVLRRSKKLHISLFKAWKVFVFGVFLVRIFPHLDWIGRDTQYLSVFSRNAGKYRLEKLRLRTPFIQCLLMKLTYLLSLSRYQVIFIFTRRHYLSAGTQTNELRRTKNFAKLWARYKVWTVRIWIAYLTA